MSRGQRKKGKDDISALPFNSKMHSTLKKEKIFVNIYAEDLYFLTTRTGWKVTKIYDHYTFKQDTFKKDFVVMNQNARKTAKTSVEQDFYKLLNNSNFGNECRSNIGSCKLELLYDGLDEINYIKKFTNVFQNPCYREFFTIDLLKKQVNNEFKEKCEKLDKNDPFYNSIYENLTQKLDENLEAIEMFSGRKNKRKYQRNSNVDIIENKIKNCEDLRKNRMLIEFNNFKSSSVKSISVKNETNVKCTTRFMSGKLLMFAKLSLKSFIHSIVELLYFPDENPIVASIYEKYNFEKIHCHHILTDTDSTAIQFIIVSGADSTYPENQVRDILFEIFSKTEISKRFDKSDDFWSRLNVQRPQDKKVLGLYEVEHVNDLCYVTLAVNPKEYFEFFKSQKSNKKHKGIKKGSAGMEYDNYAERIKPLFDFNTYKMPKPDVKNVVRISVKKGEMTTHMIKKNKFSQFNNKRFYFPNGIISLPFGHIYLNEIDEYKKEKGQRIEKYFWTEKENLLELEKSSLEECERVDFLNGILTQVPKVVDVNCTRFDRHTQYFYKNNKNVLDFILSAGWRTPAADTPTMENSPKTS